MPRSKSPLWRAGILVGLVLGFAILATACGEDEPSQSISQQDVQQSTEQQQGFGEAEQQQESAAARDQAAQTQPAENQSELTQSTSAQQAAQQEQQTTASAAAQQSQSQADSTEAAEQQSAPAQQQQSQRQTSMQQQQTEQMEPEEAVPEGTRLITLFGDITEIVYALGVQEFLVARDTSSIFPRVAEELPNLGFAGALNAEAILDFEPTLIIGTPMAGPAEVLEQLRQAGVEVLIIEDLNGLDAPQIKIRFVGQALGIPGRADALAIDVEKRMDAVIAAAENDKPLRVMHIYIRRGGLQLVSGEGNQAQTIIEAAGGIDAAAEAGIVGWQPLTPEALVAADPDVYLVMDRGLAVVGGIDGLLEIPGMAQTKAGRGPHVISMADLYLLGFGPRLPEAIADLAQFLRDIQERVLENE
ncbi:MAG: ABC transporter substrate-binding protein [Chloroflexota bacterium]|nr:ABC transporter substrate-binding protein [Chloroflexota bacterium]